MFRSKYYPLQRLREFSYRLLFKFFKGAFLNDLYTYLLKKWGLQIFSNTLQHLFLFVGIMLLLYYMLVEIMSSNFSFEIIWQFHFIDISINFPDFFLVFLWCFRTHFNDFSDCIDKISESHTTTDFHYWYKYFLNVIGRYYISKANCR